MKRWFVGMAAVGLACGGDSSGPSAASVTGVAGDNQSAPTGATLSSPLSFTALGSDGIPVAGVSVTWTVAPAGYATLAPAAGETDANGVASTAVTLGNTQGQITIQAAVSGVGTPVVYHVTILDPCEMSTSIAIDQLVNASLASSDCNRGGFFYDFYDVSLLSGQHNLRMSMRSTAFDTWADLYGPDGGLIAFDDDSILGVAQNSQLDIVLPGDLTYVIGANSFDPFSTGPYNLNVVTRVEPLNGCRAVWVVRGVSIADSVTSHDCADSTVTPHGYDVARIVIFAGATPSVLTLTARSTVINPTLAVYRLGNNYSRTLVASNDDSLAGTNTNAFVQYTVTADTLLFDILIGSSVPGETGAYTFLVSSSTTLSPFPSAPLGRGRGSWWRDIGLSKRSRL